MKKITYSFILLFLLVLTVGCRTNTETLPTDNVNDVVPSTEPTENTKTYLYNAFTAGEKNEMNKLLNEIIPFIPNNEYYFTIENGIINYSVIGLDEIDLNNFNNELIKSGYKYISWNSEIGYLHEKGDIIVISNLNVNDNVKYINIIVSLKNVDIPTENTPTEDVPTADTPTVDIPTEDTPTVDVPTEDTPTTPEQPEPVESSIQKILLEASSLAVGDKLNGERTAYGTIIEIDEPYTSKYKNISIIIGDGIAEILCHRGTGECVSSLKVGDSVVVTGEIKNYEGIIEFIYPSISLNEDSDDNNDTPSEDTNTHIYNDFTNADKTLINNEVGVEIPFIPNDDYCVEKYEEESGINFYTFGNTQSEFDNFLDELLDYGFVYDYEEDDEYGDTWYYYSKGEVYLDVSYYYYENEYVIDLYLYLSGNSTGGSEDTSDVDLITNDGKGLPDGVDGVYNVDFTTATNVKDVTDQGYYLDGCPTTGDIKVLVIPVEFSDRKASDLGYSLDKLDTAFNGTSGTTDYYSVKEYYNISSYGKLNLDFVILDSWFTAENDSSYYLNKTMDYYDEEVLIGDQVLIDEALAYLEPTMDLTTFDSDGNSIIDAVIMINTLEINGNVDLQWAYRYWNIYTDNEGYYYEYDGVSANDYLWASYQFLLEDLENPEIYNENNMNTYTYIHEFGHVLGADDYYDTTYIGEPLYGLDIMDSMLGDHNPYTKFNYGWLTSSRLVVGDNSVTLTLEDYSVAGDTIILANNWDSTLGAYQEYYVLMYYKNTGLNGGDFGYFIGEGVVVYKVNASLYYEEYEGEGYYDVYNNNTDPSDSYGTEDNLIELIKSSNDTFIHGEGVSSNIDCIYSFTVDSVTDDNVTITFNKNN